MPRQFQKSHRQHAKYSAAQERSRCVTILVDMLHHEDDELARTSLRRAINLISGSEQAAESSPAEPSRFQWLALGILGICLCSVGWMVGSILSSSAGVDGMELSESELELVRGLRQRVERRETRETDRLFAAERAFDILQQKGFANAEKKPELDWITSWP